MANLLSPRRKYRRPRPKISGRPGDQSMAPAASCSDCRIRQFAIYGGSGAVHCPAIERTRRSIRRVGANEVIHSSGKPIDTIYTLFAGWGLRTRTAKDGSRLVLDVLLPGDPIGFDDIAREQHTDDVRALTDSVLCGFQKEQFITLLFQDIESTVKVAEQCLARKREKEEMLMTLAKKGAPERVAALVFLVYEKLVSRNQIFGPSFDWPLRRPDIADALGMTPVHVSRTMSELQRLGIMHVTSRKLHIDDIKRLEMLAKS